MDDCIICIFHSHCADGLGAAWAVHQKFGDDVEYRSGAYSRGLPGGDYAGRDVLIVDFSYPAEILEKLATIARSVLVLDHHKSAQEQLAHIHPPAHYDWKTWRTNLLVEDLSTRNDDDNEAGDWLKCNLAAIFDMNRSGAGITWDFLHLESRPKIINLVEDRDLWKFNNLDSRAFNAVLNSYELGEPTEPPRGGEYSSRLEMLDQWDTWSDNAPHTDHEWQTLIQGGRDILRSNDAMVASFVKSTRRSMKIGRSIGGGILVPVANLPGNFASDAGHLMCSQPWDANTPDGPPPFVATYYDGADGKRHFSLRSSEDGADVSVIARQYGGGGHAHAAGFDMPLNWSGEE